MLLKFHVANDEEAKSVANWLANLIKQGCRNIDVMVDTKEFTIHALRQLRAPTVKKPYQMLPHRKGLGRVLLEE